MTTFTPLSRLASSRAVFRPSITSVRSVLALLGRLSVMVAIPFFFEYLTGSFLMRASCS
jgi:hypothetical protein